MILSVVIHGRHKPPSTTTSPITYRYNDIQDMDKKGRVTATADCGPDLQHYI